MSALTDIEQMLANIRKWGAPGLVDVPEGPRPDTERARLAPLQRDTFQCWYCGGFECSVGLCEVQRIEPSSSSKRDR